MAVTPRRTDLNFEEFRQLLLAERNRLVTLQSHQNEDKQKVGEYVTDLVNTDSAEAADTANAIYEHDIEDAMEADERELVRQIDAALERIANGSYGLCEVSEEPIPVERLRALPWATMTVEAAERVGL